MRRFPEHNYWIARRRVTTSTPMTASVVVRRFADVNTTATNVCGFSAGCIRSDVCVTRKMQGMSLQLGHINYSVQPFSLAATSKLPEDNRTPH